MRLMTLNSVLLACVATALAHHQGRTLGAINNAISSVVNGAQGALSHVHGLDCVHPFQPASHRPSYYTIPGYDLIIPAEEIDGPQNRFFYNEPLAPLEPIVFEPEVPLQKFVPVPIPVAPAPAPCPKDEKENETQRTLGVLTNLVHQLVDVQKLPLPSIPLPSLSIPSLPLPPLPIFQPIAPSHPIVPSIRPPAQFTKLFASVPPPPPVLPERPEINQIVVSVPVEVISRGDIPETPLPSGTGFSYHQFHKDGSVSQYGADKSSVKVEVSAPTFAQERVIVTPAPPAFIDITPKPVVFINSPKPVVKIPQNFGPVVHHTPTRNGFSYNLINTVGSDKNKAYQHSVKHVAKIPEAPKLTSPPTPKPVIPLLNLPTLPALLAPRPQVEIKPEVSVNIKESAVPMSGSGFVYHQANVDGSVTSYDGSKAQQNIEILNRAPAILVPEPPRVFLPAKSDVQVNVQESSTPVAGNGYSFSLHNGDGSVSSFGSSKTQEKIDIVKLGPTVTLPQPPRVFAPTKSDVHVNVQGSSRPASGSGFLYKQHNIDGSVSAYDGSIKKDTFEIKSPIKAFLQPPTLPSLIEIPDEKAKQVIVASGNGGYSYKLVNNRLEKIDNAQLSGTKFATELPKWDGKPASNGGFVYKTIQKDGSVATYSGASPATENISGPSPLKLMVNRIQELCRSKGISFNGYSFPAGPFIVPAPTLPKVIPSENLQISSGNGYSYKLVNNDVLVNSEIPRSSPAAVRIPSGPALSTQSSASQASDSGYKFSYSSPAYSSSDVTVKTNFVSTTTSPIFSSFSLSPIVVPDNEGYSYKQTNSDGSTLKVDSDQRNQVTVSVGERVRGDIP